MLLFFLVVMGYSAQAQNKPVPEYQVKAVFLYNFTQFVDWPQDAFESPEAPLVIGVVGGDPFGVYLSDAIISENAGTHPIIVRYFHDKDNIPDCHVLYINTKSPERVKSILHEISGRSILSVNELPGFTRWGGTVRFFNENNRIRLQVNVNAAKAARLTISSKLLNVAQIY